MLAKYWLLCDDVLMDEWTFTFLKPDKDHLACFAIKPLEAKQPEPALSDFVCYNFRDLSCT
ncbi:hypothetical protein BVRB_022570 [Beta vulgaris subsp. vulgaris]|uniref:Uncharacterized protein n=1 Tax=Beta vulgaris subsp. vulgaris TaxID=3555 RepID=A0A0J8B396_BETVV|nr:hypothetical protein BVRB_022570 [Beta vulgaris subsp. vulgaris]